MHLLAPIWLIGLLPWAVLTVWLLWGRRRVADVPFVELWKGPVPARPSRHRRWMPPPLAILAIVIAMLLAVLGAARPWVDASVPPVNGGADVAVIVDRGITMSARGAAALRYQELVREVALRAERAFGQSQVSVRAVPHGDWFTSDTWDFDAMLPGRPTAVDTRAALRALVALRLKEPDGLVVLLSDQELGIRDARVIQIAPRTPLRNVGISYVGARGAPAPQVMVRVKSIGNPAGTTVRVRVRTGESIREQELTLPGSDVTRDVFIDPGELGETVEAELVNVDPSINTIVADDRAWLVRRGAWPRVEAWGPLPPELSRMIEVYQRSRSPGEDSMTVSVVTAEQRAAPSGPAIIVASTTMGETPAEGALNLREHPVTREVKDWPRGIRTAAQMPVDFTAVVTAGDIPLVAVRERPARQVWVGFDSAAWSRSADFVVFWANAFDWVGDGGGELFAAREVGPVDSAWTPVNDRNGRDPRVWPGLYRDSNGRLEAFNAPVVPLNSVAPDADWRGRLDAAAKAAGPASRGIELTPILLTAAIGAVALAAMAWGGSTRRQARLAADAT